jgi:antitoxin component of RelBE/YafQ-DinJ toxin-antitoxin module
MSRDKTMTVRISEQLLDRIKMVMVRYDMDLSNAVRFILLQGFDDLKMDKKRPE